MRFKIFLLPVLYNFQIRSFQIMVCQQEKEEENAFRPLIPCYAVFMKPWEKVKGHLNTINAHKAKVTALCFRCGLYKQGLMHDLSKYDPIELKTGFKYYQGFRSPIEAQKEAEGRSVSWLHHKGRNMHHWEFWLDFGKDGLYAVEMPFPYVVEMFCDRVAASMIYQKDKYKDDSAWNYYARGNHLILHENTKKELEFLLQYLAVHGLDKTIALIRRLLKEYRKTGKVTLPRICFMLAQPDSSEMSAHSCRHAQ